MSSFAVFSWDQLYATWEYCMWNAPAILKTPITFEEIHIEYNGEGYIHEYDWLSHAEIQNRKRIIESDVTHFLYFTQPSNKGTIHTLQMLAEAETNEEIAAIWMYAIAFEMLQNGLRGEIRKCANEICRVTRRFLFDRFCFWHHAMRKLVPNVYTNYLVKEAEHESVKSIIEAIVLNAALIRYEYKAVLYSSLREGEHGNGDSIRL